MMNGYEESFYIFVPNFLAELLIIDLSCLLLYLNKKKCICYCFYVYFNLKKYICYCFYPYSHCNIYLKNKRNNQYDI